MKRFTRIVSFFLVAVLLFSTAAFAVEEASARASNYFFASSVYLYKTSGTTFQAWFDVKAVGIMDELGVSVIKVQRSSDGENWTTMKTYSKADYPDFICENTIRHSGCVTYTGTAGYYYRAYVELYAKKDTGTAYMPEYTSSMLLS